MQYVPPLGATDPNASYVEGNPTAGIRGSFPTAAGFEAVMREVCNAALLSGQNPNPSDFTQVFQAIGAGGFFVGTFGYAAATTGANASPETYSAALPTGSSIPTLTALVKGTRLVGFVPTANVTTNPVMVFNGVGSGPVQLPMRRRDGNAPAAADFAAALMAFRYDGAAWRADGLVASDILAIVNGTTNYAADTGAANAIVAAVPTTTTLTTGQRAFVKVAAGNTGSATANISALGALPLYDANGYLLASGTYATGDVLEIEYDGTLATPGWRIVAGASRLFAAFSSPTNGASQVMNNSLQTTLNPTSAAATFANVGSLSAAGVFTFSRPGRYIVTFDATLIETVSGANQISGRLVAQHNGQNTAGSAPGDGSYASGSGSYPQNLSITVPIVAAAGDTIALTGTVTANSNFLSGACTSCGMSIFPQS